jgi:hypothetical protein
LVEELLDGGREVAGEVVDDAVHLESGRGLVVQIGVEGDEDVGCPIT